MTSALPTRRRARAGALLLALIGGVAGVACNDSKLEAVLHALGEGCLIDSDCSGELICVFRRCHAECETTKDCRDLHQDTDCVRGETAKICLLQSEAACVVEQVDKGGGVSVPVYFHSSCPSAQLLCARDAECRNSCSADGDCVSGARCTVTGVCAEPEDADDVQSAINESGDSGVETATCIFSSECVSPLVCSGNVCREACLDDIDCAEGLRCMLVESPVLGESFGACRSADDDPDVPASCNNGMLDSGESDVDCGGDSCKPCKSGSMCVDAADCSSGVCSAMGICQVPSCNDGIKNANETDVDCGGAQCMHCDVGNDCLSNGDCLATLRCDSSSQSCVAASCSDGIDNGDESDVDCGGSCTNACGDGQHCLLGGDCSSGVCALNSCQPASCVDGIHNGSEADVDCGAPLSGCGLCGDGAGCTQGAECSSGSCVSGSCAAPSCSDGIQNGFELGIDCGGPACALLSKGCVLGTACNVDSDCDQTTLAGCHPSTKLCTAKYTVSITVTGSGFGKAISSPAGINCHTLSPTLCTAALFDGASMALTGVPDSTYSFNGFGGGCSGNPTCMLTISASDVVVTADFQ